MKLDYVQIRILPSDMKRLRGDSPQNALFENVECAADLAQVKIDTEISSAPSPAAENRILCAIVWNHNPQDFIND